MQQVELVPGGAISPVQKLKPRYCRRGHELTPNNIYHRKNGYDACRGCMRLADKRYRLRRKQLRLPLELLGL